MIFQLKEALGAEESDEIAEITEVANMDKEPDCHICNACNKTFRKSQDLERHMEAKHNEQICTYCDKRFRSEEALVRHHVDCVDFGVRNTKCNKCDKVFTNFAMRRHNDKCAGKQEFDCPECGQVYNKAIEVKKHYDSEHKMENVNSRIVCKWWRKGQCNNTKCTYSHVGHQDKNSYSDTTSNKSTRVPACRNGVSCEWLKKGRCSFFHQRVGVKKPLNKNTRGQ